MYIMFFLAAATIAALLILLVLRAVHFIFTSLYEAPLYERGAANTGPADPENPALSRLDAGLIAAAAAAAAFLFALCFSGQGVDPQLSLALFCPAAFLIFTWTLKKLGRLNRPRALWLAAPLLALSSLNAVFTDSFFTYANALLAAPLFALFMITAADENLRPGLTRILSATISHWGAWLGLVKILALGNGEEFKAGRKILRGILLALPVLALLAALLSSADMVFSRLWQDLWARLAGFDRDNFMFLITLAGAWIYFCGYFYQRRDPASPPAPAARPKADVWVGAAFLGAVNLLFLVFSWVQIAYLFQGGFMTLPPGLVYSEYAREGFFQLLVATVINFALLLFFLGWLEDALESRALRLMLLGLCLFTGVLIASSFYRLFLYIGAYGYTALRLRVFTFLSLEVFWVAITAAHLLSPKISLGRNFLAAGFVFYLLANIAGSDYAAARLNINLFLRGRLEYLDIGSGAIGVPDGLAPLLPLMEGDAYVCTNLEMKRRAGPRQTSCAADYFSRPYFIRELEESAKKWQNWSYFKNSIDIEPYKRRAQAEMAAEEAADKVYQLTEERNEAEKRKKEETERTERISKAERQDIIKEDIDAHVQASMEMLKSQKALVASYGAFLNWPCAFPDLEIPPDAGIYAVSAYKGAGLGWALNELGDYREHELTMFKVTVDSPDKPVLLILESYEPAVWRIDRTAGSRILAALIKGYHSQFLYNWPEAPVLLSSYAQPGPPCGVYSGDAAKINDLSQRLFGRWPNAILLPDAEGRVAIGLPQKPLR